MMKKTLPISIYFVFAIFLGSSVTANGNTLPERVLTNTNSVSLLSKSVDRDQTKIGFVKFEGDTFPEPPDPMLPPMATPYPERYLRLVTSYTASYSWGGMSSYTFFGCGPRLSGYVLQASLETTTDSHYDLSKHPEWVLSPEDVGEYLTEEESGSYSYQESDADWSIAMSPWESWQYSHGCNTETVSGSLSNGVWSCEQSNSSTYERWVYDSDAETYVSTGVQAGGSSSDSWESSVSPWHSPHSSITVTYGGSKEYSEEFTTEEFCSQTWGLLREADYPETWISSNGEGLASKKLSAANDAYESPETRLQLKKSIYKVQVQTDSLQAGISYKVQWSEQFIPEEGDAEILKQREFSFVAIGGVVESPEYELVPPEQDGSIDVVIEEPDFVIDPIRFQEGWLPPDQKSTTQVFAGIKDLKDPGQKSSYLSRIRWKILPIKDGKLLGAGICGQGTTADLAKALLRSGDETGSIYVMAYDSQKPGVYAVEKFDVACGPCADGICGKVENECVSLEIGLGKAADGSSAGSLSVLEIEPNLTIYSPVSLRYPLDEAGLVDVVRDEHGTVRQVKTASLFADVVVPESLVVVTTNTNYTTTNYAGYEVRLYVPDAVVGTSNGLFQIDIGANPYRVWQIEDPEMLTGDEDQVQVREILNGATGSKTNSSLFVWDSSVSGWELQKGDGAQIIKRGSVVAGDTNIRTLLITDAFGNDASETHSVYRDYSWGTALLQEIQDPNGDALTTDYVYYTDETDPARMGKLESVKYPDGSWVKYFYDDVGRESSVWLPWLDVTLEQATESNCRRIDTGYEPIDSTDIAQTNGYVLLKPRVVTEHIEDTPVKKTAYAYYTNTTERIEKTVVYDDPVSGSYADTNNQTSIAVYYLENDANADLADNIKRTVSTGDLTASYGYIRGNLIWSDRATGTFTFTANTNGIWICESVTNGIVSSPAGVANKTTMEVSYRNEYGGVELSETHVYTGSSYERISWTASEYDYNLNYPDAVGHVINRYFSDGTMEENNWSSCCGLEGIINRQGQQELYNYDALERRDDVTRLGEGTQPDISIIYGFDAAGRQVSMTETGGGLTRTTSSAYDLAGRLQSSTNEAGLATLYTYENGGRISTVTLPGGATQITEKTIDGRAKRVSGSAVVEQTYEYGFDGTNLWTKVYSGLLGTDSPRWAKTISDADGKTLRTERPGFGGVLLTTKYTNNTKGRLVKIEEFEGAALKRVTINEYDDLGNVVRSGVDVDQNGTLDLASMDRITDSDSSCWNDGTDWWQVATSVSYPKDNNAFALTNFVTKTRLTGLGSTGINGIMTAESVSKNAFGSETVSESWLSRTNKTVTQIVDIPTSADDQISVTVNGLLQSVQSASGSGTTQYGYDGLGRQTTVIDPRIGTATTHYSSKGQVDWTEDTHGVKTGYAYDAETGRHFSSSTTNGTEVITTYTKFDDLGNLTHQWGSATYPVSYEFDDYGQKTQLHTYRGGSNWTTSVWPGGSEQADTTEWLYDQATGLVTNKLYADGKGPTYTYWPNGQLKTRTWARSDGGQPLSTTYTYADTGELQSTDYSDNTDDISYTYYRTGQQKTVTDAQGTRTFVYTDEGQLDTETLNGVVLNHNYDSFGRSTGYSTTSTSPATVNYGYDAYGRFSVITSTVDSASSAIDYSYVPDTGLLSGYTAHDGGSVASLSVTKGYESDRNIISGITNQVVGGTNAGVISSFTYTNDDLGRKTRRNDVRGGLHAQDSALYSTYWNFGYNSRSELTNAVRRYSDSTPVAGQSKSYQYDSIGNRKNIGIDTPSRFEVYTANELNQYTQRTVPSYADIMGVATTGATVTVRDAAHAELPAPVIRQNDYFYKAYPVSNTNAAFAEDLEISAVINPAGTNDPDVVETAIRSAFVPQTPEQFDYDDDGNLLSDGRFSYVWNGENRLIAVSNSTGLVASYAYDYLGRRISKTVGSETTTFLWNGNHIIHEKSSTRTNTYTWGQSDHLVSATLNGTNVFYTHDGNKNVTDLVDTSGNGIAHYEFDPYGNITVKTGALADSNPFRFSNEYYDPETGLVTFKYRPYNPPTGSWLNRDPMEEGGGENLYEYAFNDPVGNGDHLGLWVIDRKGNSLAEATAEKDDTIQTLAHAVGLDEAEYRKWLTIPQKQKMPANSIDPACGTYEIFNVVYAYWAGDAGAFGRAWVQWNGNVKALESQGYMVDEERYNHWFEKRSKRIGAPGKGRRKYYWHNTGSGTPSLSFQSGLEYYSAAQSLHGVYFWGHGYTDGLYAKDGPGFNPMMKYASLSLDYKLGLAVIYACYSNSGQSYLSSGAPGSIWQGHTGVLYPIIPGAYDIKFGE